MTSCATQNTSRTAVHGVLEGQNLSRLLKLACILIIGFGEEFFLKVEIISMQVCRSSHRNEGGFQGPRILFSYI